MTGKWSKFSEPKKITNFLGVKGSHLYLRKNFGKILYTGILFATVNLIHGSGSGSAERFSTGSGFAENDGGSASYR